MPFQMTQRSMTLTLTFVLKIAFFQNWLFHKHMYFSHQLIDGCYLQLASFVIFDIFHVDIKLHTFIIFMPSVEMEPNM